MRVIVSKIVIAGLFLLTAVFLVRGQSGDQLFPTPVRSSEIVGTVPARPIGDSRLTQYYYTFEGGQGDIFINVVSSNFTGDIDVYASDTLRPLTKIVLYADRGASETGRVVYLRQPSRLLLRVQGRTPNDEAASFRIKFAGSFMASALPDAEAAPVVDSSSRLKSGSGEKTAEAKSDDSKIALESDVVPRSEPIAKEANDREEVVKPVVTTTAEEKTEAPPRVVITPAPAVRTVIGGRPARTRPAEESSPTSDRGRRTPSPETRKTASATDMPADPLAAIKLVILTKTGETIEHPMSEVVRFSVDKGMLTLVVKNGKTNRHSILNIQRVTIE